MDQIMSMIAFPDLELYQSPNLAPTLFWHTWSSSSAVHLEKNPIPTLGYILPHAASALHFPLSWKSSFFLLPKATFLFLPSLPSDELSVEQWIIQGQGWKESHPQWDIDIQFFIFHFVIVVRGHPNGIGFCTIRSLIGTVTRNAAAIAVCLIFMTWFKLWWQG